MQRIVCVCMSVFIEAYVRVWLRDIMHESKSLSVCVYVYVLAELHCPGGNGPAEYPSLTLILLPQASLTPTPAKISCLLLFPTHTD